MRRILASLLLLLSVSSVSLWANYPVIDISAITSGITQFMQTVEQYGRQIKQWQQEYERLLNAAKAISTGDFNQIMNGLQDIAGQMAGWEATNGSWDSFLNSFGDTAGLIQEVGNGGMDLFGSLQDSWAFIESIKDPSDGWEFMEAIGDVTGDAATALSSSAALLGDLSGDLTDLLTEAAVLEAATQDLLGEDGIGGLEEQINDAYQRMYDLQEQLLQAIEDENEVKAHQLEASISSLADQIAVFRQQQDEYARNHEEIIHREEILRDERNTRMRVIARNVNTAMRRAELNALADEFSKHIDYSYDGETVYIDI